MTKFVLKDFGYEVEIGKFADQADGAVWIQKGGTIVLATAVSSASKEFPGFLPLTVDYREQFSAAGKIPGGYLKREGKFSDREVLTSRLIDRAIRPLFPSKFFDQVQVLSTVYSVDKKNVPSSLALLGSSLALVISRIPFFSPVGVVEVCRLNGQWIFDPEYDQITSSDGKIVIAGTDDGICMLEGYINEVSEKDLVDVIFQAHERIKKQVEWQLEVQKAVGKQKEKIDESFDWNLWDKRASEFFTQDRIKTAFKAEKKERSEAYKALKEEFINHYKEEIETNSINPTKIDYVFDDNFKLRITDHIFAIGKRIDGRSFDKVRNISVEVGILPFAHGSALFNRGGTQALVSATLGSGQDMQKIEELMDDYKSQPFMLHYNFPPFSVGEVKPLRGVGRREIGHGHLAASALKYQLPNKEDFPYTIRIVADILASDGSTSMATTCGSTMALMDAGVPIKKMVGGVAMGLLKTDDDKFQALTDITGFEDQFGWMDFKVCGTENAVTAIQMDIKNKGGFPRKVFEEALVQAREGRKYILGEMSKVMSVPKATLSDLVPKIISIKVNTDKIGAIIGTGGKKIREIIDKTKTSIDINDDGIVQIFGGPDSNIDLAVNWVKLLAGDVAIGSVYQGKIKRLADFGAFVEILPGEDGLVHISSIPKAEQNNFFNKYKEGMDVVVEIIDYDPFTGRIRLKFVNSSK